MNSTTRRRWIFPQSCIPNENNPRPANSDMGPSPLSNAHMDHSLHLDAACAVLAPVGEPWRSASSCSKEHQKIYRDCFALADSDGNGAITGPDAMKFFVMSNLPRARVAFLLKFWAIADSKWLGYLGFGTAMQLSSQA